MGMFDVADGATKALLTGKSLLSGSGHNRYHLTITGCNSPIDIQSFQGTETLSEPFLIKSVLPHLIPPSPLKMF